MGGRLRGGICGGSGRGGKCPIGSRCLNCGGTNPGGGGGGGGCSWNATFSGSLGPICSVLLVCSCSGGGGGGGGATVPVYTQFNISPSFISTKDVKRLSISR